MSDQRLVRIAERFWTTSNQPPPPFPRRLSTALLDLTEVLVTSLPGLTVARAEAWCRSEGYPVTLDGPDRSLHGCAIVQHGFPLILIDGGDSAAEREFTVAHEFAHILLDYVEPLQLAKASLGEPIRAVFDGERAPTWDERIAAALSGFPLKLFVHLLARDHDLHPSPAVAEREALADRLAFELLAPAEAVWGDAAAGGASREHVAGILTGTYGLPAHAAREYADRLVRQRTPPPSYVGWLR